MGVITAPASGSAIQPACTARVPNRRVRSWSDVLVRAGTSGRLPRRASEPYVTDMAPSDVSTCLVVDDEPRLRRVLVRLLEGDGFVCREAGSGVEALRELEREPAPLVISDLRMPEMDGVTLLQIGRAHV